MNDLTSINNIRNAIVLIDGIWRSVIGEQKSNMNFVYLFNGKIGISPEGYYRILDRRTNEKDSQVEAIRSNMSHLTRTIPSIR